MVALSAKPVTGFSVVHSCPGVPLHLSPYLCFRRTNGFLNMLKVMKEKAKKLSLAAQQQAEAGDGEKEVSKTPIADQIKSK